MKYEFTGEEEEYNGIVLKRIKYEGGEIGGWIEKSENLSQTGNAWVSGDARVYGNAWEKTPLQIAGTKFFFNVSSKTTIQIGCSSFSIEDLQKNWVALAREYHFTEQEIEEYVLYFNLAADLYGFEKIIMEALG